MSLRTDVHTLSSVDYEWDERKAASNLRKHGIDFAEAVLVLEDDRAITLPDLASVHEERFVTLGCDPHGQVLVLAFTYREDRVRVISARRAEPREQRQYFEGRP